MFFLVSWSLFFLQPISSLSKCETTHLHSSPTSFFSFCFYQMMDGWCPLCLCETHLNAEALHHVSLRWMLVQPCDSKRSFEDPLLLIASLPVWLHLEIKSDPPTRMLAGRCWLHWNTLLHTATHTNSKCTQSPGPVTDQERNTDADHMDLRETLT